MHRSADDSLEGLAVYRPDASAAAAPATVDDVVRDAGEFSILIFDEHLTILSAAGGALAANGHEPHATIGLSAPEFFPEWAWSRLEGPWRAALEGHTNTTLISTADGETWFSMKTQPIPGGTSRKAIAVSTTVSGPQTGKPAADVDGSEPAAAFDDEALFEAAFADAPVGMAFIDMHERWLRVNDAFCRFLGRTPEELLRMTFRDVTDSPAADGEDIKRLISGEVNRITVEQRYRHKAGHWVTALLSLALVRDEAGVPQLFVSQVIDITDRKFYEAKLQRLATEDPLTGLANRRGIELALDEAVSAGRGITMLIDIDGFKHTNDGFGHAAGDDVLRAVAARLRDCTDEDAIIGRIGGDEFAVVLPSGRAEEAEEVASELVGWIASTTVMIAEQTTVSPTASIGVVIIDDTSGSGAAVLLATDIAMYDAKDRGGNQAVLYGGDATAHARASDDLRWLTTLRRALTEHRFVLHLQPIVDLRTGEAMRYEALLRLWGDDGQLLYPGAFMPAAERLRLMRDIDEWVVAEAAAYAAEYPSITLSVNLTGSSVGDPSLADRIEQILFLSQCDPEQLIFEITETEAIANLDQARALIDQLVAYGCQFALDDFGSGYASFSHLKRLPISFVKIDGQFVRDLSASADDQLIVKAVHTVAAGMDRKVVAEMIEDAEAADLLRAMGVEYGQGYYFARPAPADEVLAALPTRELPAPGELRALPGD